MWDKLVHWWLFRVKNPVVRKGERGAFKWKFRRFSLEIETLSGNFKVRFTASEHPYGYLLADETDSNVSGFAEHLYAVAMSLTSIDQQFVDDLDGVLKSATERLMGTATVEEDKFEEDAAIEEVKAIQEYVELPQKVRRKIERDSNGRFKKAVKQA